MCVWLIEIFYINGNSTNNFVPELCLYEISLLTRYTREDRAQNSEGQNSEGTVYSMDCQCQVTGFPRETVYIFLLWKLRS